MCLRKSMTAMPPPKTPTRSPYRRHLRELRPKLSRKVVPGARVNLNSYWNKFEELDKAQVALTTLDVSKTGQFLSNSMYSTYYDNEINENLVNELLELANK